MVTRNHVLTQNQQVREDLIRYVLNDWYLLDYLQKYKGFAGNEFLVKLNQELQRLNAGIISMTTMHRFGKGIEYGLFHPHVNITGHFPLTIQTRNSTIKLLNHNHFANVNKICGIQTPLTKPAKPVSNPTPPQQSTSSSIIDYSALLFNLSIKHQKDPNGKIFIDHVRNACNPQEWNNSTTKAIQKLMSKNYPSSATFLVECM